MDKKKKPPPGATLISRLRESRIKRDRELAERQAEDVAVVNQDVAAVAQDVAAVAQDVAAKSPASPIKIPSTPTPQTPSSKVLSAPASVSSTPAKVSATTNLISSAISIDDLRPISDDYDLLTDEIRLAGRFAAAGLIAQGLRLKRLREVDIYSKHYPTFEDYCRAEHNMSATYAYRLVRMSEMAERLAASETKQSETKQIGRQHTSSTSMPDPFEVLLGLGHRHLLALLPLQIEIAQELLVRGIPLFGDGDGAGEDNTTQRIPLNKATEQQIRAALKALLPTMEAKSKKNPSTSMMPSTRSVRTLKDMVDLLQDWAAWLESEPDEKHLVERLGEGRDKSKLVQRLRTLTEKILNTL